MTENEKIIALLETQNSYLQSMSDIMHREHREAALARILHSLLIILPTVGIIIAGYFLWSSVNHYLEVMNNNINTLKSNFDAMASFVEKLIPDFGKISSELNQTWQNIQFWK